MKTLLLIVLIVILLLMVSIPIWLAIRVMRHPEKDSGMRRVMAEERGEEYEKGMQKFLMVNYLSVVFALVMAAVLERVFRLESTLSMLIAGCVFCLVLVIAKWRFTGELSKAGCVTLALGVVFTIVYYGVF